MSSLIVGRHYGKNMVGNLNIPAKVTLLKRYTHKARHNKNSHIGLMSLIIAILSVLKRIDYKVSMAPNPIYWVLWGAALFVFAVATISLEMQWISYLMKSWN